MTDDDPFFGMALMPACQAGEDSVYFVCPINGMHYRPFRGHSVVLDVFANPETGQRALCLMSEARLKAMLTR